MPVDDVLLRFALDVQPEAGVLARAHDNLLAFRSDVGEQVDRPVQVGRSARVFEMMLAAAARGALPPGDAWIEEQAQHFPANVAEREDTSIGPRAMCA